MSITLYNFFKDESYYTNKRMRAILYFVPNYFELAEKSNGRLTGEDEIDLISHVGKELINHEDLELKGEMIARIDLRYIEKKYDEDINDYEKELFSKYVPKDIGLLIFEYMYPNISEKLFFIHMNFNVGKSRFIRLTEDIYTKNIIEEGEFNRKKQKIYNNIIDEMADKKMLNVVFEMYYTRIEAIEHLFNTVRYIERGIRINMGDNTHIPFFKVKYDTFLYVYGQMKNNYEKKMKYRNENEDTDSDNDY